MKCSLCGHEFDENEAVPACAACLMSKNCKLVKCPNCGYEMPKEPKWLKKIKDFLSKVYGRGSFSDRVGNSIKKTEYPISNTEYPTDEVKKKRTHPTVGEN